MAEHLSEWHDFRANDQATYPKVMDSPLQLRFVSGSIGDFDAFRSVLQSKAFHKVSVSAWRYIKGPAGQ
jgi:hypothetical protein